MEPTGRSGPEMKENVVTAKKKSSKKKASRQKAGKKRESITSAIERELQELGKRMERELKKLERSIDAAQIQAAREAAKLIHQARIGLARADIQGTADWQKFLRRSQVDLVKALARLEKAIKPKARRKKAAAKKKAAARKKASAS
jgi:hypothetical protein